MSSGDYSGALDLYTAAINDENAEAIPAILNEIRGLLTKNVTFSTENFEKIKSQMTSLDEDVQELAIDIFTKVLIKFPELLANEFDFCKEKTSDYDPIVRSKFIDFLIDLFPLQSDLKLKSIIIKVLSDRLADELWKNRLKVIEFLNHQLNSQLDILKPFKMDFLKIVDEKDLDVANGGLDFLFRLNSATYNPDDLLSLIQIIPRMDWSAQEKILWLFCKLCQLNLDIPKQALEFLVTLLDADDYLLQQKAESILRELMESRPEIFNEILIAQIKDDRLENVGAIEQILKSSIEFGAFPRFLELFQKFDMNHELLKHSFHNIIKKIINEKPAFMEALFRDLTNYILQKPDPEVFVKFIETLKSTRNYDIYLTCYNILKESAPFPDSINETQRQNCLAFILSTVPQLGYLNLSNWLKNQLKKGPVYIDELCQKFSMKRDSTIQTLKKIIKKGLIEATIAEDKIDLPGGEESTEPQADLRLLKRWQIQQNTDEGIAEITFFIKLTNTLNVPLTNFNIFLTYPRDSFIMTNKSKAAQFQKELSPGDSVVVSWTFHKKGIEKNNARVSFVKLVIIYLKEGKISSLSKKMDLLLL